MPLDPTVEANRKAALSNLKFKKSAKTSTSSPKLSSTSQTTPWHAQQQAFAVPPLQSRDGSLTSRYFPATPAPTGKVLVPNSSPGGPDSSYREDQALFDQHIGDSLPGLPHPDSWRNAATPHVVDPLSAPSGFVSGSRTGNASSSRPWSSEGGVSSSSSYEMSRKDSEPPRKRVNRGDSPAPNVVDPMQPPGSPEIVRYAHHRKPAPPVLVSVSSNDSLSDVAHDEAGPSRPRIIRGQRPDTSSAPPLQQTSSSDGDARYMQFRTINQMFHTAEKLRAAWDAAKGNESEATELLKNPNFGAPPKPPSPVARARPAKVSIETGRVKELEEASKAEKARVREMGKKSAIYITPANPTSTPPVSAVNGSSSKAQPPTPTTPISPQIQPRARRNLKRKTIVSEDEYESSDGDGDSSSGHDTSEEEALQYFNSASAEALQELTGCSIEQAQKIVELRPFTSVSDLKTRLNQGRKKAGPAGISTRMFEDSTDIFRAYGTVDGIVSSCETIGQELRDEIAKWGGKGKAKEGVSARSTPDREEGALTLRNQVALSDVPDYYISSQPASLSSNVQLKEYQMVGINWLNLLYTKQHNAILADEMGLGKTVQVISFFAHLKDNGSQGPHLIVVPSSTLENWIREFKRFAPAITVAAYYAGKDERPRVRQRLRETHRSVADDGWEVLVTTYNLAQGDDKDRKFFRSIEWDTCVFDEGHVLKNYDSQRYQALVKVPTKWRLLLTGTPLQNNLQELMSLMNFILPVKFKNKIGEMRAAFKTKGDSKVTLLAQERVSRAKKMMTPFVLRRRKDQVLQDLPKKTERIEWCEMTAMQRSIYNDALRRSRKTIFDLESAEPVKTNAKAKKTRSTARAKDKMFLENSSNVLMDLRKAASHPMLFRRLFTDDVLSSVAKVLLKEPDFKKRGARFDHVKEDMEVMTDSELQLYFATYKSTRRYLQKDDCFLQAGKVKVLLRLLRDYQSQQRRVLIFSQFTQILDILQRVLEREKIKFLVLTGSTPVDVRQSLVDEFTEDESIQCFLLSTKAGGMGINLTAASVVVLFDQDFNPHNDKQAQDRAYRIGQKRDVEVVKLITKGSIEEDMLELGRTKLALDDAVAGEENEEIIEKEVKTSLMNVIRQKNDLDEADGTPQPEQDTATAAEGADKDKGKDTDTKKTDTDVMEIDDD